MTILSHASFCADMFCTDMSILHHRATMIPCGTPHDAPLARLATRTRLRVRAES
jgi:hypothetical protein